MRQRWISIRSTGSSACLNVSSAATPSSSDSSSSRRAARPFSPAPSSLAAAEVMSRMAARGFGPGITFATGITSRAPDARTNSTRQLQPEGAGCVYIIHDVYG